MLRVLWNVIKSLIGLVFKFLSPFKRLVCRKRKNSSSDFVLPVGNSMGYDSTTIDMTQSVPDNPEMEMQSWDSWGTEDRNMSANTQKNSHHMTAQQYISNYRNRKISESEPEPEIDYFQDLAPEVKKAPKIYVKKKEEITVNKSAISNRLAMASDVPVPGSELESWDDSTNVWSDEAQEDLSWEAEAAIREKRRMERQERSMEQQRRKTEREMRNTMKRDSHINAVKLS